MMHVEYEIRLSDHAFAVAEKHKLTPSVYAFKDMLPNKYGDAAAVSYKGDTFIRMLSMQHDATTTFDHRIDLLAAYLDETLKKRLWTATGPRPVLFVRTDGGLDQNVRYDDTIRMYAGVFKKLDLDMIYNVSKRCI